jgi:succinoglycan biosynthesis transport protein ExoP
MQPTEGFSIPRRTLDVEDYVDIVRRHKGWIFGPFLFTLVASVVGVYLWPDSYLSQAVVKIVPQQVPENMVQSAINQQMNDRINSMSQTILSRTTLTTIINNFGLYQRERNSKPIEDLIEEMRKKISILPVTTLNAAGGATGHTVPAFVVQFSYENRYLAQRVVQDLVSRFIDENIRNRSNASFQTTQFLKDQMDQAKKELDDNETKLAQFRMQNNGRLPDQMDSNMRQLMALQAQVTYLDTAISRSNQDKLQLEANLRIYKDQLSALSKEPTEIALSAAAVQKNEKLAEVDREIQAWETQLSALRQHYKDSYPDVQTVMGRLNIAKQRREDLLQEEAEKKAADTPAPARKLVNQQAIRETRDLDATMRRVQSAIEGKDLEIQEFSKDLKRANDAIKAYQGRIETVPMGEKQYGELLRDREISKEKYIELDAKLEKAQIAQEMEGRKQGETLELLDPASLPQNPTEPKRPLIVSIGAGLGLLLGIMIAGAREVKDTSLKNLKDVRAYTQMAILGSVPLLENDFVVRRRKRLAWLGWTTACLAAAVIIAGSIVYYYVTKI